MANFKYYSETVKPVLVLEEYIPIQIEWKRKKEVVQYLEYDDGHKSLLEIVIGAESRKIHKIIMPLCDNYVDKELIESYNIEALDNIGLYIITNSDKEQVKCDINLYIYENGINIVLSSEPCEVYKYIENGRIRFGMDKFDCLIKIDIMDLSSKEKKHIIQELELQ